MGLAATRLSIAHNSLWGRLLLVVQLAVLVCGLPARSSDSDVPSALPVAADEPITPIPQPPAADPLKVKLGELLFNDPKLSRDGTRACVSCHDAQANGAKPPGRALAHDGPESAFDTVSVFNAPLSFRLNWEGNFRTLEAHTLSSLESPGGLQSPVNDIVSKLAADTGIESQFVAAYGHYPDPPSLLDAFATYERSLLTPGSRFDLWLEGDTTALSAQELAGYQLFKSYGCVSCHQGMNIGGNLFERQGIFHPLVLRKPEFVRVPSLRNVAATAPYFHDGSAATLEEAVRKMAFAQLNRTMSEHDIAAITAFLRTLTGNYRGHRVGEPP
ncbi:MAG: c-type cytochrome [Xanthobacteraceae bacterium]|nr:c-type cytochrome [Xanthobacteraceae bacterium]